MRDFHRIVLIDMQCLKRDDFFSPSVGWFRSPANALNRYSILPPPAKTSAMPPHHRASITNPKYAANCISTITGKVIPDSHDDERCLALRHPTEE